MTNTVTCVIVNYNTPQLTETAIETFRNCYDLPVILIDNHSVKELPSVDNVTLVVNTENIGHGPAMHQGIMLAHTKYVFTLDSDTETIKCGFLEKMLEKQAYAVGWKRYVNLNGISGNHNIDKRLTPYIHPYAMLLDREVYLTLPHFEHRGSPCTMNMYQAYTNEYQLVDFPIDNYVKHLIAGTRRLYNGKWYSNDAPQEWKENASYKI